MKTVSLFALAALLTAGTLSGQGLPWISSAPTITFSESSDQPVVSGLPTCIDMVQLAYSCTCATRIIAAEIRGDSLIFTLGIDTLVDPIPLDQVPAIRINLGNGYGQVFDNAGVYKAFERQDVVCIRDPCPPILVYRGSFRILPKTVITPTPVTVRDSLKLRLLLGQADCWSTYDAGFRVAEGVVYLSFSATGIVACTDAMFPVSFGPSFNLGLLPAGTYPIMMEDSIPVATVMVYDNIIVNGNIMPMTDPRCLSCGMAAPISGATVFAAPAPHCSWLPMVNAGTADTVWTESDSTGRFTLSLPNSGTDYAITALGRGFYPQTMYLKSYPMMESFPPQVNLSYELVTDTDSALAGCEISVTGIGGAPVESASVSLSGGREMMICLDKARAKAAAGTTYLYGYTDRQGRLSLKDASLDPFIDYLVHVYKNGQSASDLIRLNRFTALSYDFTLNVVGVEATAIMATSSWLDVRPNPFKPAVTISFANPGKKADIAIYNVEGKLVHSFKNFAGNRVSWNAEGIPSGLYVLKARINGLTQTRKLVYSK